MKKIFVIFASALAALCSCTTKDLRPAEALEGGEAIRVTFSVSAPGTRAVGVASNSEESEAKVNTLQIFVFNGDALDGYASVSNSKTATVTCTSGSRDIYALVNAENLSAVTSKAALLSTVSSLVEDIDNFQMIGSKTETLQYDGTVNIPVDRLAARVVLRGIKNAHSNAALGAQFRIVSVYLTNVAGDVDFGKSSSYSPSAWYNRRGYEASNNLGSFTYDAVNEALAHNATNSTAHFFYAIPNAFGLADGTAWSPRRSKLVIRCEIAGTLYDYPINLPVLESNKSYEINLVNITKNGNLDDGTHDPDDPDDVDEEKPVEGFDQGFSITVNDWTVVLVDGGEITI